MAEDGVLEVEEEVVEEGVVEDEEEELPRRGEGLGCCRKLWCFG